MKAYRTIVRYVTKSNIKYTMCTYRAQSRNGTRLQNLEIS